MKENKILKQEALDTIRGKWGSIIGAIVVYFLITVVLSMNLHLERLGPLAVVVIFIFFIVRICITPTLVVGLNTYLLKFSRNQEVGINTIFEDFKAFPKMRKNFNVVFLRAIYTFLWTLLFIIPGVIKAISYSQTLFISIENPELSANDAIVKSMEMMKGHKAKYFSLGLSFLGWFILGILSLGIGFIWIVPYMYVTTAKFYEDLKSQAVAPTTAPESPVSAPVVTA